MKIENKAKMLNTVVETIATLNGVYAPHSDWPIADIYADCK